MPSYSPYTNYFGLLNEWRQLRPSYRRFSETYSSTGADHLPIFTCDLTVVDGAPAGQSTADDQVLTGRGRTQKAAKQDAARKACIALAIVKG